MQDKENAFQALVQMLACSTLPNLFDNHPPFQIDGNFGGVAEIAEMLIQSYSNEIVLLPALPESWKAGSIKGLKARGGLEVSMRWRNSMIEEVELVASTSNTFRIRLPDNHNLDQILVNEIYKSIEFEEILEISLQKGDRVLIK